jgi:hypothetical protein
VRPWTRTVWVRTPISAAAASQLLPSFCYRLPATQLFGSRLVVSRYCPNDLRRRHSQRRGNPENDIQARMNAPRLQSAHVGAINCGRVGELFLRETALQSERPKRFPKCRGELGILGGLNHCARFAYCVYSRNRLNNNGLNNKYRKLVLKKPTSYGFLKHRLAVSRLNTK